jgi:hypothetical protein
MLTGGAALVVLDRVLASAMTPAPPGTQSEMTLYALTRDDTALMQRRCHPTRFAGSCGDGFLRKLAARGISVVVTGETDSTTAIAALLSGGKLAPAVADHDDHEGCECQCAGEHRQ